MNLQEFINFRQLCPICDSSLVTGFHSNRKQLVKCEDNRATFIFDLNSLDIIKKPHKVAYSFGLLDSSFQVEFYTKDDIHYHNHSPDFLRSRFLDLHKNLEKVSDFKFFRGCTSCRQYAYSSNFFHINLKLGSYDPLQIWSESVGFAHSLGEEGFRIIQLVNMLKENRSILCLWKNTGGYAHLDAGYLCSGGTTLNLPLIPFVSKEETFARLNKLIIFT